MKILNHSPWFGTFPFKRFRTKIWGLKVSEGKSRFISGHHARISLNTVLVTYSWISDILERIDNSMNNHFIFSRKLDSVKRGEHVSVKELPPSGHFLNLDINSLIIFLHILLDDVSRFKEYLFVENRILQYDKFLRLKKSLKKCNGDKIKELSVIFQKTEWYKKLNDLRRQPVVHTGVRMGQIMTSGENIGVYLMQFKGKKKRIDSVLISNLEIDEMCDNIHSFLEELNEFLCVNFDYLPFNIKE